MSVRIALANPSEFYTNLDVVRGWVVISLTRDEHVAGIIVKLEGESRTALGIPADDSMHGVPLRDVSLGTGSLVHENHKILYKVAQVFPDPAKPPLGPGPVFLAAGQHEFPFELKLPFNNMCGDSVAMARLGGFANAGGFAGGGFRVMDGTKQLMYSHVTRTLPPSFTGFPGEAEIRYYLKVTIQRPGFFKENWRHAVGLKFLPIEPVRPPSTNQEAYARRPFVFRPRAQGSGPVAGLRKSKSTAGFGAGRHLSFSKPSPPPTPQPTTAADDGKLGSEQAAAAAAAREDRPPFIEMSARLPYPPVLTCNKPIPLRLIAKPQGESAADVRLVALQIDLVAQTVVRSQDLLNTEVTRWVVMSRQGLSIPLTKPDDRVGKETVVPDDLWSTIPLPNTVMPSFLTCNLRRTYQLEIKLGLSWVGRDTPSNNPFANKGKMSLSSIAQDIHLPLHFSTVEVYSGLAPPDRLVQAMRQNQKPAFGAATPSAASTAGASGSASAAAPPFPGRPGGGRGAGGGVGGGGRFAPTLPPRQPSQPRPQRPYDPLYPPQLAPGQAAPPYDDAPPSYDEAMADAVPPIEAGARPAYSGVTNENAPSSLPEKS